VRIFRELVCANLEPIERELLKKELYVVRCREFAVARKLPLGARPVIGIIPSGVP
jgi:hypothetical protein